MCPAPNAKLREQVVQTAGPSPALLERLCQAAECMGIEEGGGEADDAPGVGPRVGAGDQAPSQEPRHEEKDVGRRASRLWAMLIARIYEALPLLCPHCGQPLKIISFITAPKTVGRILEHLGLPATPPPIAPARGPPQGEFDLVEWDPDWD